MKIYRKANAHISCCPNFWKKLLKLLKSSIYTLSIYTFRNELESPNSVPRLVREKEYHLSAASQWKGDARPSNPLFNSKFKEMVQENRSKRKKFQSHLSRMYWSVSAMPACSSPMRDGWKIISGARILSVPTNSWWYAAKLNTGFKNPRFRRYF